MDKVIASTIYYIMRGLTVWLLVLVLLVPSVGCFLLPQNSGNHFAAAPRHQSSSTARFVLAENERIESASQPDTSSTQPIRRLRRDKKEPLIAVVGRPNVVSGEILFFVLSESSRPNNMHCL